MLAYQPPFDLLFSRNGFEYDTVVAHTISYSNPQELHVRITRLAAAAGWAS
jgi:hypothetical protein